MGNTIWGSIVSFLNDGNIFAHQSINKYLNIPSNVKIYTYV